MTGTFTKLAKFGKFSELKALWESGAEFDLAQAFHQAVQDFRTVKRKPGHLEVLKFCLDQGLPPTSQLICIAARHGNRAIISEMLARDAGLDRDPFVAACLGDLDALTSVKNLSKLRDASGYSLLHRCAASGLGRENLETGKALAKVSAFLIKQGCATTRCVEDGELSWTPALCCAGAGGNVEIMRQLLDAGEVDIAELHQEVEFTLEPHQRSGEPFYDVAKVILDRGFDLNSIRPSQGRTLLHGSANRGAKVAVVWLLENGADPNARDTAGRTPLHVAAERNTQPSVLELLVQAGADPSLTDSVGATALDKARERGRDRVAEYLRAI